MIREYGVPFLLALAVHLGVFAAFFITWPGLADPPQLVAKPNIVKAELIVMEPPKAKPAPKPQPDPAEAARRAREEAARQDAAKKEAAKKEAARQEAARKEAERRQAERRAAEQREAERRAELERQRKLEELASASFDKSLAAEAEALAADRSAQIAQSYAQGIYNLVVANWSRPPTARMGMSAELIVELVPTGEVVSVTVVRSSGNAEFDDSAVRAVKRVGKFDVPEDPRVFEQNFRRFHLLFNPKDLLR